jgi:predicted metal-dependent HD superfamily phosphohydrolase
MMHSSLTDPPANANQTAATPANPQIAPPLLEALWQTWRTCGVVPDPVERSRPIFDQLVQAYSTPGRYYHTLVHVQHVLGIVADLRRSLTSSTQSAVQGAAVQWPAVYWAAWFHDAIYETQPPQAHPSDAPSHENASNETRSAIYAAEQLQQLPVSPSVIATVQRLILATQSHQAAADDLEAQILLDADLAILASAPSQYATYAAAIRQEYAWVSAADYRQGRSRVLQAFLDRPAIYHTPAMRTLGETQARSNLQAELNDFRTNLRNL